MPDAMAGPDIPAQAGGFNQKSAIGDLYSAGFIPEAMQMQAALSKGKKDYTLKPGESRYSADNKLIASSNAPVPPSFAEKEAIKSKEQRIKTLREGATSRQGALQKAQNFRDKIAQGKMSTGAWRKFAQEWIPGVWTEQGALSEEFNSFAEIAARSALKASGEIRPTDADVKGMKEAMFGVGRDENVNVNLLDNAIAQMKQDEAEYQTIAGGAPTLPGQKPTDDGPSDINSLVNKYAD